MNKKTKHEHLEGNSRYKKVPPRKFRLVTSTYIAKWSIPESVCVKRVQHKFSEYSAAEYYLFPNKPLFLTCLQCMY